MDFDDVAFGVVEEDLLPAVHGPGAVVGEGDALGAQVRLEGFDVVGAEGDVALVDGIDGLARAEADIEIAFGQMELRRAVRHEGDLAGVALVRNAARRQGRFLVEAQDVAIERVERGHVLRYDIHVMQLELHGYTRLVRAAGPFEQKKSAAGDSAPAARGMEQA